MSLAVEQVARREAELRENPGQVPVRVKVRWEGSVCVPDPAGEHEEKALFSVMTVGDHLLIEEACRYEVDRGDGRPTYHVDFNEVRRLTLKRNLLSWTLNVPVEREGGWITSDSYERVGKVGAPLVEAFLDGFWERSMVTGDEEKTMGKQAAILFGKNSRGVSDACEGVRLYCTMSSQWDKFGIKEEELDNMPYRKYLMLRLMVGYESEAMRRDSAPKTPTGTRIAGKGGRTRPSQGKRIPL